MNDDADDCKTRGGAAPDLPDWVDSAALESLGFDLSLLPPASHRGHDGRDCWHRDVVLEILRRGASR